MTEANTIELQADDVVAGRYRICKRLGRGGMGTVYESQQITLDRKVALKVLRPEFAGKEMAAKRFEREAKSASSIDHRNVVNILDFGHLETGELYYTMELLQGRDLSQVLKEQGALPWSRAGWIILQVVRAFAAIHDKGIVHRDLKPANCVLLDPKPGDDPDFIKILDFGIANLQDKTQATALTGASDIIGSAPYMAPEQVEGKEVDARTDIYSLGIMMYELLTGKVPFREQHIYKIMMQHLTEAPQPPRELAPDIPPEVEGIILRAIAKKPEDRYQSMAEIELDLSLFVEKPQASAVMYRTSPSASSADRSAAGSGAGRPMLGTRPGPTGTIAVGSSPSMRATRQYGPAAETTPRVGASMGFNAQTYSEPQRRRGMLLPIVLVLLVFGGAIGLTVWLQQRNEQPDEVTIVEPPGEEDPKTKPTEITPDEGGELGPQLIPEAPYSPFEDPFGAPPLSGRKMLRPMPTAGGEVQMVEVPLETILPPESWTLEPGSLAGRILGEKERPLAKAQVCAWIVDPAAPLELRRKPQCARVDRQGRFEIPAVKPSLYDLSAFAPGHAPLSLQARDGYPVVVESETRTDGIEMVLVPGGVEVRGTVKTKLGDPIPSAFVSLAGAARSLAVTNPAGEFSLWTSEAEGEIAVLAWANGYTDVMEKGPARQPFSLSLRREGILFGKFVDPETDEPIERARIHAGPQGGGFNPVVYTDSKGEFKIIALPEGKYLPTAHTNLVQGSAKKAVQINEGAYSAEVVIMAEKKPTLAPSKPPEPTKDDAVGGEADTDATAGTDGSTGGTGDTDGTESGDGTGGEPASVDDAGGVGDKAADPVKPSDSAKPADPVKPADPAKPADPPVVSAAPAKPVPTNKSVRQSAAAKLKKCGTNGQITITATYYMPPKGTLFQPKVTVTGEAAKDPAVKACAEKVAKGIRMPPPKEPTKFEDLNVKI